MPKLNRQFVVAWHDADDGGAFVGHAGEYVTVLPASRLSALREIERIGELWHRTYGTWKR